MAILIISQWNISLFIRNVVPARQKHLHRTLRSEILIVIINKILICLININEIFINIENYFWNTSTTPSYQKFSLSLQVQFSLLISDTIPYLFLLIYF